METLRKEAEKEQYEFQVEWGKLENLIEKDKNGILANNNKGKAADKNKLSRKEINSKEESKTKTGNVDPSSTNNIQASNAKATGNSTAQNNQKNLKGATIRDYDAGFKSIFEATQINDIDTLISQFEKAENNNYSLLKYAESLSSDIKDLDGEIKTVESEIAKYEEDTTPGDENNREKQFEKFNDELEKTEMETKEYEEEYQNTVKTINQLKIGIKSIFDRIG
mmetsp:Transcript_32842/g.32179  ORF Transcript_32842/g.32179 Transcript_32842/m.32179 type:complete len:223 (+) Transcript_32842:509-1177(+)